MIRVISGDVQIPNEGVQAALFLTTLETVRMVVALPRLVFSRSLKMVKQIEHGGIVFPRPFARMFLSHNFVDLIKRCI